MERGFKLNEIITIFGLVWQNLWEVSFFFVSFYGKEKKKEFFPGKKKKKTMVASLNMAYI
jgi:hypothetical protein